VAHQPAISFSISSQPLFNRAGGRTFNVLQEKMISKANSRGTTVGAERFRYKVSSKPVSKGVYELNVTIQNEARNASKLLVTGIMQHDYRVNPPQSHDDHKYLPTILRIDVDGFIKEALANGWDCAEKGQDFRLCASNEMFLGYGFWEIPPKDWYHGRNYEFEKRTGEQAAT
jgi:hypothetical protein